MITKQDRQDALLEKLRADKRDAALYHVVRADEGFDETAQALFKLIQLAEQRTPGKPRRLFLDIEGHRNEQGGFDQEMYEFQTTFMMTVLARRLTSFHCPLASGTNPHAQDNDIPPTLIVRQPTDGGPHPRNS